MKFLADRTTGKLARKLRALGYDVLALEGGSLDEAARIAVRENRVLLTRSRRLSRTGLPGGVLMIEADRPREQVAEVSNKLMLKPEAGDLFTRCLLCNEKLVPLAKSEAEGRVPEFIYRTYQSFQACPRCRRVYWPGTHLKRMEKDLRKEAGETKGS